MKKQLLFFVLYLYSFILNSQTPTLQWAKNIGEFSIDESGTSIALDAAGNVYTTGEFKGIVDFDPGAGTFNLSATGVSNKDIFISKLDANGNFVWAKNVGGTSDDVGNSIHIDPSGNIYLTGEFQGTADFDPGAGISNLISSGLWDAFVLKLDPVGNFVWARQLGGIGGDIGFAIKADISGNVYTAGTFQSSGDFDPGAGIANLTSAGFADVFVSKLDLNGNFIWAKKMGGPSDDIVRSLYIDNLGNVLTTGQFELTADFDPGVGTFNLSVPQSKEIFISKLDVSGNFVWAKQIGNSTGASYEDIGRSITCDAAGNVYVTGHFYGTALPVSVDFDPGAGTFLMTGQGTDVFVLKLNPSGNFIWAKQMGGTATDVAYSICLDVYGNIYTSGRFASNPGDFDPGLGVNNMSCGTATNVLFISKLDNSGNFIWATQTFGASYSCYGYSVIADNSGNVYCTGDFQATFDFDPSAATFNLVSGSGSSSYKDMFVYKLSGCSVPSSPTNATPSANLTICTGNSTVLSASGSGTLGWYTSSSGGSYLGGGVNYTTPILTTTTTFYVQDSTCTSSTSRTAITVIVNSLPTVSSTTTPSATVCAGTSVTLSGTGASSYTWTGGVTNATAFTASATTTYTVTGTDANGCTNTATRLITVNPLPTVSSTTTPSATVCDGSSVTLSGTGASSYTWTGGITNATAFTPSGTTTYTVTGTDANGCTNTAIRLITVNPLPTVSSTASPSAIVCAGTSVTLNGTGASSYTWTGGITNVTAFIPSGTTTYTVTGTDANGCTNTATQFITVNPLPAVSYSQSPSTVCINNTFVPLSVGTPAGGVFSGTAVSGTTFNATAAGVGTFTITYSYTDANACMNTDTSSIVVDLCTGIEENQINNFMIYPNPSTGVFTIQSNQPIKSIEVYNVIGEVVLSNSLNTLHASVDLSNQQNGIYFIRINNKVKKVIKN